MISLQFSLRKGLSLGHVGRNENLKDLKDHMQPDGEDGSLGADFNLIVFIMFQIFPVLGKG